MSIIIKRSRYYPIQAHQSSKQRASTIMQDFVMRYFNFLIKKNFRLPQLVRLKIHKERKRNIILFHKDLFKILQLLKKIIWLTRV